MSNDLIARLEAATGPDDSLDLALAEYAWDNRIPMPPPYYEGGPINYDPRLWLERHDWQPTSSIDAALTLVPEGWLFSVGSNRKGAGAWAKIFPDSDDILDPRSVLVRDAATPALAICIAALKAKENSHG